MSLDNPPRKKCPTGRATAMGWVRLESANPTGLRVVVEVPLVKSEELAG